MTQMEFKHTQLDNGLTIIAEVNGAAASMAAGFFVRTGSRDETPDVAGVSHFLEHMMFKGTDRRTPFDINREFDEMGARYNAFTSEENTVYYAAVLPEFQSRALDLLGDMLRPALRKKDFDLEKDVILEEIAMYQDMPRYRLFEKIMAEHFCDHPLGNSVLGTPESIKALLCDNMQAYFDRCYSPANTTVVGVGNLDFDAFVEKTSQMCSHWKRYDVSRRTPAAPHTKARKLILDEKLARQHLGLISPAPPNQSPQRYAAQLAATIVGDSTGSRLYYALIDRAIADEATMSYDAMDEAGAFVTFVSADPQQAARAVEITQAELRKFFDDGPSDAELVAAKNKIASSATLKGELPMGRLLAVGFDWVYRKEYVPLSDQIEILFRVTKDELMDVVRQYDLTGTTIVALGPVEEL